MKIIKSQSGDFTRAKGKEVMESFLKSPDAKQITALFAHNDDMALGAIQAMEEAGIKPGKDILIVSIDGVKGAFEAMAAGKLNCTVECNPQIGPQLFDAVDAVMNKKTAAEAHCGGGGGVRPVAGGGSAPEAHVLSVRAAQRPFQNAQRRFRIHIAAGPDKTTP